MNREHVWATIKDNVLLIVTVAVGVLTAICYPLGWIPQRAALSVIIGLLTLFATSEILERRRRFARVESMLENGFEKVIESLGGVEIQAFATEREVYEYLAARIQKVQGNVRDATLGPSSSETVPDYRRKFYASRAKVIAKGRVHYRYVTMFSNRIRFERVRREIEEFSTRQFYVGCFDVPPKAIPMLSLIVIDNEEVIIGAHRRMYAPSERNPDVLMRHPVVVRLFSDYFDLLWRESTKLNERGIREDLLDSLSRQIDAHEQLQASSAEKT